MELKALMDSNPPAASLASRLSSAFSHGMMGVSFLVDLEILFGEHVGVRILFYFLTETLNSLVSFGDVFSFYFDLGKILNLVCQPSRLGCMIHCFVCIPSHPTHFNIVLLLYFVFGGRLSPSLVVGCGVIVWRDASLLA